MGPALGGMEPRAVSRRMTKSGRDVPLPIHGLIPMYGRRRDDRREVVCSQDEGPFAEAFRFLRGNLPEPAADGKGDGHSGHLRADRRREDPW